MAEHLGLGPGFGRSWWANGKCTIRAQALFKPISLWELIKNWWVCLSICALWQWDHQERTTACRFFGFRFCRIKNGTTWFFVGRTLFGSFVEKYIPCFFVGRRSLFFVTKRAKFFAFVLSQPMPACLKPRFIITVSYKVCCPAQPPAKDSIYSQSAPENRCPIRTGRQYINRLFCLIRV